MISVDQCLKYRDFNFRRNHLIRAMKMDGSVVFYTASMNVTNAPSLSEIPYI